MVLSLSFNFWVNDLRLVLATFNLLDIDNPDPSLNGTLLRVTNSIVSSVISFKYLEYSYKVSILS